MQQPPAMIPMVPSVSAANLTTDQIQKYLDENKRLISAIMENQNLGKLAECAQYQALLQKNLMYLAAIADAQPQTSAVPPQGGPHPSMSPGGFYIQHPQSSPIVEQQQATFHPITPLHFNSSLQQQSMQGQMGNWPGGGPTPAMTVQKERKAMD